ncbi:hypothetical protein CANMA_002156 [Candida margitis]|uniref:uncharacterized protein n=1 Tax=Candida margitis TaxID=1775924 RepID=UPI002227AD19|nr:uncharacterized protein CANMA_002156 [Candida margitis]KAI5968720.1 hypothetical protein CANMA_002156 [Candida margitis]
MLEVTSQSSTYNRNTDSYKSSKLGVTHSIRNKLNFLDDRLWKRFSARRLELIDTMDLSSRKASEQELEIRKVAETLRIEFGYDESYTDDFDKLVRAAVQSVRRNRKRNLKRERDQHSRTEEASKKRSKRNSTSSSEEAGNDRFLSEIVQHEDEVYDVNYNRTKQFSSNDHAVDMIEHMTKPRLPPLSNFASPEVNSPSAEVAKKAIINKIERSKTCNESTNDLRSSNLQFLGMSVVMSCIGYICEKSFTHVNQQSLDYLRNKLCQDTYLAKFFRELDPLTTNTINDEVAVISLYTLLGGLVKDFGFDEIINPVAEILYVSVVREYPLISRNSIPFTSVTQLEDTFSLSKLAEVASTIQSENVAVPLSVKSRSQSPMFTKAGSVPTGDRRASSGPRKRIILKFLNQSLEFFYPSGLSATPRFYELLENAKSAFNINNSILEFRYQDRIIQTDQELEKVFRNANPEIELEISTQTTIPIQHFAALHSAQQAHYTGYGVNNDVQPKIILPPPLHSVGTNANDTYQFKPDANEAFNKPQPMLPKFQPLL